MDKIIGKRTVSESFVRFEIKSPIAEKVISPGQYIVLRTEKGSAEIILPVLKSDKERGTVVLGVQVTSGSTLQLANLTVGNEIYGIDGPFGKPLKIENFGTVLCIGRGQGIAFSYPVLASLRAAGNRVVAVLSARTKDLVVLEAEIRAISDEVIILTDDGSYGGQDPFCSVVGKIIRNNQFGQVYTIGCAKTVKETFAVAQKQNIATQAILHLGKSGENRLNGIFNVNICGSAKAVCVDGLNFNAYYTNFEEMAKRFGNECPESVFMQGVSNKVNIPV
jgi:glutamate synthase (NADPH/NADH) small chain